MAYSESQLDKRNAEWFKNDTSKNTLMRLTVAKGKIRGVSSVEINFSYPITAIVGENGAGKSTILALASCAFHNVSDFYPQNRIKAGVKRPRCYYTYGDFFTFSPDESGITGIEIWADYLTADGLKRDIRKKKPSGKWNDFNRRPARAVAYMGINRIVPPSESSPHRHYYRNFKVSKLDAEKTDLLKDSMSKIIGRSYSEIELMSYNTYRLFEAKRSGVTYTGFNMGAGENAVLGLILEILAAGPGALIVVDELELGLHVQAQCRLVEELKRICYKYHCQIICSTHSKDVLSCLPPSARIFLKRSDNKTDVIPEISPEYAFGKLSGQSSEEVSVFVEDEVGKAFLDNILPQWIRERIKILPVGCDAAVLKHMAVHYREKDYNYITFLDGDKRSQKKSEIRTISKHLDDNLFHSKEDFEALIGKRLNYIPGTDWPERMLIEDALKFSELPTLADNWAYPVEDIAALLENALAAGRHNEFFEISKVTHLSAEQIRADIIRLYKLNHPENVSEIVSKIEEIFSN